MKRLLKWLGFDDLSNKPMEPFIFGTPRVSIPEVNSKKARIKIAVDESIGSALARKIEARGYEIVARA